MENWDNNTVTNGEVIKHLIRLEENLYEKFRQVQEKKLECFNEMLSQGVIRCKNCKMTIRRLENSFFENHYCKTCVRCSEMERKNRKDIIQLVNGKWKKTKYFNNGWWLPKPIHSSSDSNSN